MVAAFALFLFAAWWAVKLVVVQEAAGANPFFAAMVAPNDPRVRMQLGVVDMMLSPGRTDSAPRAAAIEALGRSALADEPFVLAASRAQARGDGARAERLLLEARHRNPRNRLARLMLVERYLGTERWAEAGREIAVVTRLVPKAQDVLAPGLAKLAADPRFGAPMADILGRDAALKDAVLSRLVASGVDAGQIVRLAGARRIPGRGGKGPAWQEQLLSRVAEAGDVRGGYVLWARFTGLPAAASKPLYDPDFRGLPGAPPFNWDYPVGEGGHVEPGAGGLQVDYYGRLDAVLVRQLLLLAPGRYRLAFRAEGDARGDGAQLQWTIVCAKGGGELLRLPIREVAGPRRFAADFAVPAGCEGQWLALSGSAGDVATQQSAAISGLRIVPARAG